MNDGSEQLTLERHRRRHKATRKKLYCATPEGVEVTAEVLIEPLAGFLAGGIKIDGDGPPLPPDELNDRLGRIPNPYPAVALAILAPLLDAMARSWDGFDSDSWRMLLAKQMGRTLCDWLALKEAEASGDQPLITGRRRGPKSRRRHSHADWSSPECVEAGDWMLEVATRLPSFGEDDQGRISIAPEWEDRVDRICDDLVYRHPVMLPHTALPKPWTGWSTNYTDRLRASFVRDWRPETRSAIEATFAATVPPRAVGPFAEQLSYSLPFAHADGVNALKRVPLRINRSLLPLIDKFAVELMDHNGKQLKADRRTVKADLRHAKWVRNQNGAVYLDYSCDKRGRIYAAQQLNYAREDHVRSLFEFDRGEPLSADGCGGREAMHWLEIHAANCGPGHVDKKPWADRLLWCKDNTDLIERVSVDPQDSFDLWRDADKPFAFVAACRELVHARRDPIGFRTHLPIGFDGTCNGIQHLAMLARDEEAGKLVNLIDSPTPQDIYGVITQHIMTLLKTEDQRLSKSKKRNANNNDWCFDWWRRRLYDLKNERDRRKLFKSPIMTFAYSVTAKGMADKLLETYRDLFRNSTEPKPEAIRFLAKTVRAACEDLLPGPTRIMNYVRKLALYRYKQEKFLEWRTGTGFPVSNRYQEPNVVDLDLGSGGVRSRYTVADGALPKIKKGKILNAASPNFVHSLDATHLIRTVLSANNEGIRDILTVHDSMACLAPHARLFGQIIRREMAMLYIASNPLADLRKANVDDPNILPLPPFDPKRDNPDLPYKVLDAEYPFM